MEAEENRPHEQDVKPKNDSEEMGQGTSHRAQALLRIKFHGEHATSLYSLMVLKLRKYEPMKEGAALLLRQVSKKPYTMAPLHFPQEK